MRKMIVAISLLVASACASAPVNWNYGEVNVAAIDVSIIELIASPTVYDDKIVRVSGVISFEFEGTAIYLTEEHFKNGITENSIWVEIDEDLLFKGYDRSQVVHDLKYFQGKYVTIEGKFSGKEKGHLGLHKGAIRVSRLY